MAKTKDGPQLTPLEIEVMEVLWETGPTTVQGVHARFQEVRSLAFNTVQTVLAILHRKGMVKRTLRDRAYVYRPAMTRETVAGHALRDLIDRMFQSRPEELVLSMGEGPPPHAPPARRSAEARGGGGRRREKPAGSWRPSR